jgi:hypothetical protein
MNLTFLIPYLFRYSFFKVDSVSFFGAFLKINFYFIFSYLIVKNILLNTNKVYFLNRYIKKIIVIIFILVIYDFLFYLFSGEVFSWHIIGFENLSNLSINLSKGYYRVSAFMSEPSLLALVVMYVYILYYSINVYYYEKPNYSYLILIISVMFLTRSLTAYIFIVLIVGNELVNKSFIKKIIYLMFFIPFLLLNKNIWQRIYSMLTLKDASFRNRILGGFGYSIYAFINTKFLGFALNNNRLYYDNYLNALIPNLFGSSKIHNLLGLLMASSGILGVILFFILFMYPIFKYHKNNFIIKKLFIIFVITTFSNGYNLYIPIFWIVYMFLFIILKRSGVEYNEDFIN